MPLYSVTMTSIIRTHGISHEHSVQYTNTQAVTITKIIIIIIIVHNSTKYGD